MSKLVCASVALFMVLALPLGTAAQGLLGPVDAVVEAVEETVTSLQNEPFVQTLMDGEGDGFYVQFGTGIDSGTPFLLQRKPNGTLSLDGIAYERTPSDDYAPPAAGTVVVFLQRDCGSLYQVVADLCDPQGYDGTGIGVETVAGSNGEFSVSFDAESVRDLLGNRPAVLLNLFATHDQHPGLGSSFNAAADLLFSQSQDGSIGALAAAADLAADLSFTPLLLLASPDTPFGGCVGGDPSNLLTFDSDGDGHPNLIEIQSDSDMCNPASTPHDWDGDGYSNMEECPTPNSPSNNPQCTNPQNAALHPSEIELESAAGIAQGISPGETQTFTIQVRNDGRAPERVHVSAALDPASDWTFEQFTLASDAEEETEDILSPLFPTVVDGSITLALAPGESADVIFTVTAPTQVAQGGYVGDVGRFKVTLEPLQDDERRPATPTCSTWEYCQQRAPTVDLELTTLDVHGIDLSSVSTAVTVLPGAMHDYAFTVTSNRNADGIVQFAFETNLTTPASYTLSPEQYTVQLLGSDKTPLVDSDMDELVDLDLPAQSSQTVYLRVAVPAWGSLAPQDGAYAGDQLKAHLTASMDETSVSVTTTTTTGVVRAVQLGEPGPFMTEEKTGLPGVEVSFPLEVVNHGNVAATATLTGTGAGSAGRGYTFSAGPAVSLGVAGRSTTSGTASFTVGIPAWDFASPKEGAYEGAFQDFTLTATTATASDTESIRVRTLQVFDVQTTAIGAIAKSGLPGSSHTYTLEVTNRGNGEDTFSISTPIPADFVSDGYVVVISDETLTLPAKTTGTAHVGTRTVTLTVPAWDPDYPLDGARWNKATTFMANATSENGIAQSGKSYTTTTERVRGIQLGQPGDQVATATALPGAVATPAVPLRNMGNGLDSFTVQLLYDGALSGAATKGYTLPGFSTVQTPVTETRTDAGTTPWVAPWGVTSVTVELWGAGGGGGNVATTSGAPGTVNSGGGGGGGAYSRSTITVTPGNSYDIAVGAGGSVGAAGGDSRFGPNTVVAKGGAKGGDSTLTTQGAGGAGGSATAGTGTVKFPGGAGGGGADREPRGGGGGSAGSAAAGGAGASSGTGGTGGSTGGGAGGNGATSPLASTAGTSPGGGGGGRSAAVAGGNGAAGKAILSWNQPSIAPIPVTLPAADSLQGEIHMVDTRINIPAWNHLLPKVGAFHNAEITFSLTASITGLPAQTDTERFKAITEKVSGMAVTGDIDEVTPPGSTASFPLKVTNTGNGLDSYVFEGVPSVDLIPDGYTPSFIATPMTLGGAQTGTRTVTIEVPPYDPESATNPLAAIPGEKANHTANVTSLSGFTANRIFTVTTAGLGTAELTSDINTATARNNSPATYVMAVQNVGTGPFNFTLSASATTGWTKELTDCDGNPKLWTGVLAELASDSFCLIVTPPMGANNGVAATTTVTASAIGPFGQGTKSVTTVASQTFALDLGLRNVTRTNAYQPPAGYSYPDVDVHLHENEELVLSINATNLGNGPDAPVITMTGHSGPGGALGVTPTPCVPVGPGTIAVGGETWRCWRVKVGYNHGRTPSGETAHDVKQVSFNVKAVGKNPSGEFAQDNFTVRLHVWDLDIDRDGIPDAYDPDMDSDGYLNVDEINSGSDQRDYYSTPLDNDGDGIPNRIESFVDFEVSRDQDLSDTWGERRPAALVGSTPNAIPDLTDIQKITLRNVQYTGSPTAPVAGGGPALASLERQPDGTYSLCVHSVYRPVGSPIPGSVPQTVPVDQCGDPSALAPLLDMVLKEHGLCTPVGGAACFTIGVDENGEPVVEAHVVAGVFQVHAVLREGTLRLSYPALNTTDEDGDNVPVLYMQQRNLTYSPGGMPVFEDGDKTPMGGLDMDDNDPNVPIQQVPEECTPAVGFAEACKAAICDEFGLPATVCDADTNPCDDASPPAPCSDPVVACLFDDAVTDKTTCVPLPQGDGFVTGFQFGAPGGFATEVSAGTFLSVGPSGDIVVWVVNPHLRTGVTYAPYTGSVDVTLSSTSAITKSCVVPSGDILCSVQFSQTDLPPMTTANVGGYQVTASAGGGSSTFQALRNIPLVRPTTAANMVSPGALMPVAAAMDALEAITSGTPFVGYTSLFVVQD